MVNDDGNNHNNITLYTINKKTLKKIILRITIIGKKNQFFNGIDNLIELNMMYLFEACNVTEF